MQEMGGSKSGVTLVNYRSDSTFEGDTFLFLIFLGNMELLLQNTYEDGHWKVPRSKTHCVLNISKLKK